MQIAPEQGAFMTILTRLVGARHAVEVGTFTGYSSLCIARGLPSDGKLLCCDVNGEWTTVAREHWAKAGLADRIELRLAPASETLDALPLQEQFDLAFIDADKVNYRELLRGDPAPAAPQRGDPGRQHAVDGCRRRPGRHRRRHGRHPRLQRFRLVRQARRLRAAPRLRRAHPPPQALRRSGRQPLRPRPRPVLASAGAAISPSATPKRMGQTVKRPGSTTWPCDAGGEAVARGEASGEVGEQELADVSVGPGAVEPASGPGRRRNVSPSRARTALGRAERQPLAGVELRPRRAARDAPASAATTTGTGPNTSERSRPCSSSPSRTRPSTPRTTVGRSWRISDAVRKASNGVASAEE